MSNWNGGVIVECFCRATAALDGAEHGHPLGVPVHRGQRYAYRDIYA